MAWVIGIKQVTLFQPEREGKQAIPKPVRVVASLLPQEIERTLSRSAVLPENTGAGPCGTLARLRQRIEVRVDATLAAHSPIGPENYKAAEEAMLRPLVFAWSIAHLVEPLAAYYAAYKPPIRFGAKDTPRGRRCA